MHIGGEVVSSIKHPAVAAARRSLGQVGSGEPRAFLLDGHRLVAQALESDLPLEGVFFLDPVEGEEEALFQRAAERGVACHVLRRGVFFRLLGLGYETSVRVLAVVQRPRFPDVAESLVGDACVLVGEDIQDPRNVGVLIRTADGWGSAGVVLSQGSADPYCRGSVRSSTGSVLRVPVTIARHLGEYLARLRRRSVRLVGTSARGGVPCWEADLSGPCAILLGNESRGLSAKVRSACDLMVTIPMLGGAHSFNVTVAAGILLYERARQRAQGRGG